MTIQPLVLKKRFKAPREIVFAAFSDPEIMKLWLKPNGQWKIKSRNNFKVGGDYEHIMIMDDGNEYAHVGEYKEIIHPEKIVFTWSSHAVKNTLVTVELEEKDGYTNMTFKHDLFPNMEQKEKHNQGWDSCFKNLEDHFGK